MKNLIINQRLSVIFESCQLRIDIHKDFVLLFSKIPKEHSDTLQFDSPNSFHIPFLCWRNCKRGCYSDCTSTPEVLYFDFAHFIVDVIWRLWHFHSIFLQLHHCCIYIWGDLEDAWNCRYFHCCVLYFWNAIEICCVWRLLFCWVLRFGLTSDGSGSYYECFFLEEEVFRWAFGMFECAEFIWILIIALVLFWSWCFEHTFLTSLADFGILLESINTTGFGVLFEERYKILVIIFDLISDP